MSDRAVLVVLLYMLFSFAFGVLVGKMIRLGQGGDRDDDPWA